MKDQKLFRPVQGKQTIWVYEIDPVYDRGIGLVGHMDFDVAIKVHGNDWRWMTDDELNQYEKRSYEVEGC